MPAANSKAGPAPAFSCRIKRCGFCSRARKPTPSAPPPRCAPAVTRSIVAPLLDHRDFARCRSRRRTMGGNSGDKRQCGARDRRASAARRIARHCRLHRRRAQRASHARRRLRRRHFRRRQCGRSCRPRRRAHEARERGFSILPARSAPAILPACCARRILPCTPRWFIAPSLLRYCRGTPPMHWRPESTACCTSRAAAPRLT